MKKSYTILLLVMVIMFTGCSDIKKLTCKSIENKDDKQTDSVIEIKVKDNRVSDMKFTVDMKFKEGNQQDIQSMADSIKTSKPYMDVTLIDGGIRLVTTDDKDSFIGIKMDQEITYNELKEVLELQEYVCE